MKCRPSANAVPRLWEVDGSLRDMYVFSMSMDDWAKFLLLAAAQGFSYSFDGATQDLPSLEQLLSRGDGSHLLSIQVGSASVNCHFFTPSELELDIDPMEVGSASQHNLLLEFVEAVASRLQKPVILTPENLPESPILSFDPGSSQWQVHT